MTSLEPLRSSWSHRLLPAAFVALWSTGFLGAKLGLPYAPPFAFLSIRFAVVLTVLGVAAVIARAPWPDNVRSTARLGAVGMLLHGLYLGGVFYAIHFGLAAGVTALIVGLQPLLTAALARPLFGERVTGRAWFGLCMGLTGVGLVVADKVGVGVLNIAGLTAATIALLGITAGTLYQKRHGARMNLMTGSIVQFLAAAAIIGPAAIAFETIAIDWTPSFLFAIAWLSLVLSIGAISLLHLMIRRGEAAKVASLFFLTPSVTAMLAYLLFGETLGVAAVAGFALTAGGVAMVMRS